MERLTKANVAEFLASKPYALVLLDAEWNKHKELAEQFKTIAETYPGNDFAFGELDVDADHELTKEFEVLNVPAVCYIFMGQKVKTVIGNTQSIKEQTRWFLEDCENGWF
jgi:thioredoxin-like negative regulator of GroEL